MGKFWRTRSRKWSSLFLLTVLMLSISCNTSLAIVWGEEGTSLKQNTNYQKLLDAHLKNESSVNELSKKAFEENVKAQLASRGFDVSQFNENAFDDNQEIRLIVQLKKDAAIEKLAPPTGSKTSVQSIEKASDSVIESQTAVKKKIETLTGNKSDRAFGYLINGFSIDAKYKDVETIKSISGVESVSAAKVYYPTSIDANQLANVQQVWKNHQLKGEGMVVSIIDSGIDPTHKDLRLSESTKEKISLQLGEQGVKNIGYGQAFTRKVPYGHNYADNNEDIVDTNPGTNMHGMHVAGIVAANGIGEDPAKAVLGVAPEAQLLAMKVFPNNTRVATALDDDIIAAIEDSVKLGADVLNMSLGSVSGTVDPDSPEQLVIKQAAEAGVLSVISAGNSSLSTTDNANVNPQNKLGTIDTGTLGSPGVTTEALTVASAENTYITSEGLLVQLVDSDGTKHVHKMETSTSPSGAIVFSNPTIADKSGLNQPTNLIDVGMGTDGDYDNKDVKGKIVLIQRGSITFSDKQRIAEEHGASAAFIYNNTPNSAPINMQLDNPIYLTLSLTKEDGEALVKLAQETKDQKFSFDISSYQFANPKTGKMSDFSSWGLTPDLEFKPEISAPGGNIYSTVNNNGYQTKSGTSMSSPFVAGSQALIYQALKKGETTLSGTELTRFAKLSVMNTALPMFDKDHDNVIISPRRQGAGQIKVDKAIENTTSLTDSMDGDGALALKQIGKNTTISVKLQNNGKKSQTYQFTDFGGVYTETQTSTAEVYETKIEDAQIIPNQKKVTIQPGEIQTVQLQLKLPDSFSKQQFVEGYIGFTSDSQPNLTMPFVGFYGDYSLAPVIDAPSYDSASIQKFGHFTDKNNTLLGLKGNEIDPNLVAISPNKDNRKDEAKPVLNFLRNAKNVTYEIVDGNKKVIRRLAEEKKIRKDTFSSKIGRFSTHTIKSANWDGMIYNMKTGKNEIVPDGQYHLKVVAKATIDDAKAQEMFLPIKVDTTEPKIEHITFDNSPTEPTLKVNLSDQLSGVDLRSVTVSVNGKIKTYDLSDQNAETVAISLDHSQKPSVGQNQIEILVSDYAGNHGYQNQYIQYGAKDGLVLFNLTDDQIITSNTANFSATEQTLTVNGSYPRELFVNGIKATINEKLFKVAVPLTNETKTIKFSNDSEGHSIIRQVPITVYSKKPDLVITDPSQENSTTDQVTYTLTGTTGVTTAKLELVQTSNSNPVDLTPLIQTDGHFKTTLELVHGQNLISIRATDEHGNQTVEKRIITTTGYQQTNVLLLENITVSGVTTVGVGNPNYDSTTGIYTIKGRLREKVDHFTINKQEVPYDPKTLTFSFPVELKQGKHSIAFYVQSDQANDGKPLLNEGYYVIVDTVLPTLQMENLDVDEKGNYFIYTNENPFHLKGLISDNFSGYKLFVNNENIHTDIDYHTFDEKFFEGKPAAPFDYKVPVTDGENHVQVGLTDSTGNTTSKAITVFYKNELPKAPTITANPTTLTNQAVTLKAVAEDNTTIFYSFDGEHYERYTDGIAVAVNQKVYFNAVDRHGNKSEVTTYEVTNIQNEIAAKPVINVASKTRVLGFTPPVQVTITYEKELTKEQESYTHLRYSLDKGQTYQVYTTPFEQTTATEVWAQSYDDAGNESEIIKTVVQFKEQEKPKEPTENSKPDQPSTEKPTGTEQTEPSKQVDKQETDESLSRQSTTQIPANSSLNSKSTTYQGKKQRSDFPQTGENRNSKMMMIGILFLLLVCGDYFRRNRKVK
ncbi:S8 family serine peptidase [Enterococcus quebecensis]|uniref:Proteinase b n=1 Tax=Enterococcus quebecensis TaxID=903983 RepID=A0A1E5GUU4_9ENTE|nr:S8 family serine peptidase [Enterococcus quebecensis]OEG16439.1 proteinase b [Enterococcus quebecensis]